MGSYWRRPMLGWLARHPMCQFKHYGIVCQIIFHSWWLTTNLLVKFSEWFVSTEFLMVQIWEENWAGTWIFLHHWYRCKWHFLECFESSSCYHHMDYRGKVYKKNINHFVGLLLDLLAHTLLLVTSLNHV